MRRKTFEARADFVPLPLIVATRGLAKRDDLLKELTVE